jgi:hypothetical protein
MVGLAEMCHNIEGVVLTRLLDYRCNTSSKLETPIHDNIRESVTWECKEHGVKS